MDAREFILTLPAELVDRAVQSHGKPASETVADALQSQLATEQASEPGQAENPWAGLLALRGKVKFEADWRELRGKDDER